MLIVPAINVLIGEKAILSLGLLSSVTYVSFIALISIYFYYYYHLCFSDSYTHIWVRHKYAPECSFEQFCNNFQDFQSNGGIRVFYLWLSVKNLTRVLKINLRVLSNIYIYIYIWNDIYDSIFDFDSQAFFYSMAWETWVCTTTSTLFCWWMTCLKLVKIAAVIFCSFHTLVFHLG